ncbi:type VII secretion target [Nocardia sp. NPDC023852]|uniref:type VII secretion target n=1 Tax=Nocardia sp. NPDC023852 TaxID=3154697 RepID=UPI003406B686
MPDRLDMDPNVLRRLADGHDAAAERTRAWARQPKDWLKNFRASYGPIATPVERAMVRYYGARERAGNAMADQHDRAARNLREAADSFERADDENSRRIRESIVDPGGPDRRTPISEPSPDAPPPPGPAAPPPNPSGPPPGPSGPPGGNPIIAGGPPTGPGDPFAPPSPGLSVPPVSGPVGTTAPPLTAPGPTRDVLPGPAAVPTGEAVASPGGGPSGPGSGPSGPYGGPSGPGGGPSAPSPPGGGARSSPAIPPFSAAVAARKRAADPAYVVGEPVNDDLLIARTLLAAVLGATESVVAGVAWAVAVLRGPSGAGLFITTNEGRGWLPAGVFLPREVSSPWLWDELLDDGTGSPSTAWEGIADPARVLVEFGRVWGPKAGAALTALVSSGPIDPGLRAQLGNAATEGMVGPAHDLDLRVPTADTADRLGLTGSVDALEHVASVPDTQRRDRCLELAADAHVRLGRTGPIPPEADEAARWRDRILARLQARQEVPRQWWNELRDADDWLAASLLTRRLDVARVGLGGLRVEASADALRALAFQRRCNELVLLLDGKPGWQQLRDEVYAHEQVVKHPAFADVRAVVAAPESRRYERPLAVQQVTAESNERAVPPTVPHPIPRST